jgi:hypothetical protein
MTTICSLCTGWRWNKQGLEFRFGLFANKLKLELQWAPFPAAACRHTLE